MTAPPAIFIDELLLDESTNFGQERCERILLFEVHLRYGREPKAPPPSLLTVILYVSLTVWLEVMTAIPNLWSGKGIEIVEPDL